MHETDPTKRFSSRVDDYVRFRPGYPQRLIDVLAERAGLRSGHVVADVGSGTGILSRLLLDHGARVCAVEPNAAMRAAAERDLAGRDGFVSVDGSPFMRDYERLLVERGVDYTSVDHRNVDEPALRQFFADVSRVVIPFEDALDYDATRGRMMSASYVPGPDHPGHGAIIAGLEEAFRRHQRGGRVAWLYDTEAFVGHLP